jgi:hypothetical protein
VGGKFSYRQAVSIEGSYLRVRDIAQHPGIAQRGRMYTASPQLASHGINPNLVVPGELREGGPVLLNAADSLLDREQHPSAPRTASNPRLVKAAQHSAGGNVKVSRYLVDGLTGLVVRCYILSKDIRSAALARRPA